MAVRGAESNYRDSSRCADPTDPDDVTGVMWGAASADKPEGPFVRFARDSGLLRGHFLGGHPIRRVFGRRVQLPEGVLGTDAVRNTRTAGNENVRSTIRGDWSSCDMCLVCRRGRLAHVSWRRGAERLFGG